MAIETSEHVEETVRDLILGIHRRNGGTLQSLDFSLPLLDPSFCLDSLDLAEIMAALERRYGSSPFDAAVPPKNWNDVCKFFGKRDG